ncbi:helix-turn-helix domain-containing protein [Asaia krungthepensis]|uniref:Transcriptional regulator n=1 Tax=Asaia krungthepensis NRIC 0535 TaxID=1307925 RepID=A0ABQ0Q393_9PROT|nr:helix-turn-helix transcriptional regulator [Asaia krungthepensis]GBQ89314.1 putative transcriptional regulator [Asaia krungthepensis NRIC 0535]
MGEVRIISETADTVTVSRSDWEAILDRLDDQRDRARIAQSEARPKTGVTYTAEENRRMVLDDVSPVRILRERQGMTQAALAEAARMSKPYLSEIEKGEKPSSVEAIKSLAVAPGVSMDDPIDLGVGRETLAQT